MRKRRKIKKRVLICLFLCLILLTSYVTMYTLSKYMKVINKSGETSVAKWVVSLDTAENVSDTLNVVAGNTTQEYKIKVTSTSEVASNYSVILLNIPDGVQVSIDNSSFVSAQDNKIKFNNVGSFNVNEENTSKEHILTFRAPLGTSSVTNNGIDIKVEFVQKEL